MGQRRLKKKKKQQPTNGPLFDEIEEIVTRLLRNQEAAQDLLLKIVALLPKTATGFDITEEKVP